MIKYIVFDFDGTIADTYPIAYEYLMKNRDKYTKKDIDFGQIRTKGIKYIIKETKVPLWRTLLLIRKMKKVLHDKVEREARLFTGFMDILPVLGSKYKLGIVSSNSEKIISSFLRKHKIAQFFEFIYSDSSMFGKDKVFTKFMKKYGLKANEFIYVGDDDRDVIACKKLHIPLLCVTWGFNAREYLQQYNPTYLLDRVDEIPEYIEKIKTLASQ